jgi:hypothetical protein
MLGIGRSAFNRGQPVSKWPSTRLRPAQGKLELSRKIIAVREFAGLLLANVPATHMDEAAPSLLNVLRVCDIPDALGMVAPRPVLLAGAPRDTMNKAAEIYRAAGVPGALTVKRGGRED